MNVESVAEELDALEQVPLIQSSEIRPGQNIILRRPDTVEALLSRLRETSADGRTMLVFDDGLPGSGKTGMARKLIERSEEEGLATRDQVAELPLDFFIGTERGSQERARLTDDPDFFQSNYVRYGLVREALAAALEAVTKRRRTEIHLDRAYDRDNGGSFKPHSFEVPADTKLLIVEGAGAISQVAAYDGVPQSVVPISVWIGTSIREGLFRGTLRDTLAGRGARSFEDIYMSRVKEYRHLVPWARDAVRRATHICLRYPEDESFAQSLVKLDKRIANGRRDSNTSVREVLAGLDPEFLRLIFPGKVPKKLRPKRRDAVMALA
ncbi:hypothetical protein HY605_01710 [Candidatus Peregrinibacteria bacterium]|nr:hypothetical protein [Candidatus Peregrinibacteria bacterium]